MSDTMPSPGATEPCSDSSAFLDRLIVELRMFEMLRRLQEKQIAALEFSAALAHERDADVVFSRIAGMIDAAKTCRLIPEHSIVLCWRIVEASCRVRAISNDKSWLIHAYRAWVVSLDTLAAEPGMSIYTNGGTNLHWNGARSGATCHRASCDLRCTEGPLRHISHGVVPVEALMRFGI